MNKVKLSVCTDRNICKTLSKKRQVVELKADIGGVI